jgi:predicted nucleic acid-binding protein
MSVISNTTVLANFAAIDALDSLRSLFREVFLSTEVHQEIQRGLEEGYSFYSDIEKVLHPVKEDGWLRLTSLSTDHEVLIFSGLPAQLHAGEASCLAIAQQRNWMFLTDDKAARRQAHSRKIAVSGTLGCLVLGVERGLWTLDQANEQLGRIIAAGFFSPLKDLAALMKKA